MNESKETCAAPFRQGTYPDEKNVTKVLRAFEQPQWYLKGFAANIRIRSETIASMTRLLTNPSILDIGCGDGSLSLPLLEGCSHLTLLDRSRAMLEIAASRVSRKTDADVELINSDFLDAPLAEQSYDLVLCVGVLAYVKQRRDLIAKIKTLLKPGGSVIIECTDGEHLVSRLIIAFASVRRIFGPSAMNTVVGPSKEIETIFSDLGFTLRESYRYSLPFPLLRKLMPQWLRYRAIRTTFGEATRNRNARWGNECIFHFTLS